MLSDDDIFEMYANQADREYLKTATVEQLATDIRLLAELDGETAIAFAQAIKRVIDGDSLM